MKRKAIRSRLIVLMGQITAFTGKVTDSSPLTVNDTQLPRLNIFMGEEEELEQELLFLDDQTQTFSVDVDLEITANGNPGTNADFVDDSIYQIRNKIREDITLSGNAVQARYFSASQAEPTAEGEKPNTQFTITLKVIYEE